MDVEKVRTICLGMKNVSEELPFDEETPVYKVWGKMFCLSNINPPQSINLKNLPEKCVELRENYEEISPGYHMNKKHWITVDITGRLEDGFIENLIKESYSLVYEGLPKKVKEKF